MPTPNPVAFKMIPTPDGYYGNQSYGGTFYLADDYSRKDYQKMRVHSVQVQKRINHHQNALTRPLDYTLNQKMY
jgi:hypothetical protein